MKFSLNLLDSKAQEFCEAIVLEMVSLFSITEEEAISRVNYQWNHLENFGGEEELIYHEDENFWAQDIYYGPNSYWWLSDKTRSEKNLPKLRPRNIGLVHFFEMFNTTDDQGWCDIGYEISEKIVKSYDDEDWSVFVRSIEHLNKNVYLGVLQIFPLIPSRFRLEIIEILLCHASGEAWLDAFTQLSKTYESDPISVMDILHCTNALEKFEQEFSNWVNFDFNENDNFDCYYLRYRHLIDTETQEFYESLQKITSQVVQADRT